MKLTIPTDHPIFKDTKVGDLVSITAKVTEQSDDGAVCEVDKCELAEPAKVREKAKKVSPVEYLLKLRRKAA